MSFSNRYQKNYQSYDKSRGNTRNFNKQQNYSYNLTTPNWSSIKLQKFQKDFYFENETVRKRSRSYIEAYHKENEIATSSDAPNPIETFKESGLPKYIQETIKTCGYQKPTLIQSQSWPSVLSGNDFVGIAETGSGKTLAFLLPAIVHINAQPPLDHKDGPIVLILAPTRELASQIHNQSMIFSKNSKIRNACVYGGTPKGPQIRDLTNGADIVIATPGRLLDFLDGKIVNLLRVTFLILDEADRMLDMGFEKPIRDIIAQIRPDHQTLLFSATWPKEIQRLSGEFLNNPIKVSIGSIGLSANKNVEQRVVVTEDYDKMRRLNFILAENYSNANKILIFTCTKIEADNLTVSLSTSGFNASVIHGDKNQHHRENVLHDFRCGKCKIMVATDVASRGIDVKDITCVINYDYPKRIEDYVHRIGRTGRANSKGIAYSLFTKADAHRADDLINLLKSSEQKVPPELIKIKNSFGGKYIKNNKKYYRG